MTIRLASEQDVPGIAACARDAYALYVERIGREPAPMVADFRSLVADGRIWVDVAETGKLAGFVVFYPDDGGLHLENVAVAPDRQGQGVGRRLIAFVEDQAKAAGHSQVSLYTNEKMTENQTLYPRLGYEEAGRRVEAGFSRVYYIKRI